MRRAGRGQAVPALAECGMDAINMSTVTQEESDESTADHSAIEGMVPEWEIRWTIDPAQSPQPTPATADWPAVRDHRDLAVHELADSEALLHERVASLEADVDAYRVALCESMALNVRLTAHLETARRQLRRGGRTA